VSALDAQWLEKPEFRRRNDGNATRLKELLLASVDTRASGLKEAGLLFSGGVDSSLLAFLLNDKLTLTCYCAAAEQSHDWLQSQTNAEQMGVELVRIQLTKESIRAELPAIVKAVGPDVMKVGVAIPLWFCAKEAKEKHLFFGMGTEEVFAGYDRHRRLLPDYRAIDAECLRGLLGAWERDVTRDQAVCRAFGKEPLFPYLDQAFVEEGLAIPAEEKIDAENNKLVLRRIAAELGLPKEIAFARKKAAQYGSHSDKIIRALAKEEKLPVGDYLARL